MCDAVAAVDSRQHIATDVAIPAVTLLAGRVFLPFRSVRAALLGAPHCSRSVFRSGRPIALSLHHNGRTLRLHDCRRMDTTTGPIRSEPHSSAHPPKRLPGMSSTKTR